MKKMLSIAILALGLVSCKKDTENIVPATPGTITVASTSSTERVAVSGTGILLGTVRVSVGKLTNPAIGGNFSLGGTIDPADVDNIRYFLKKGNDSIQYFPSAIDLGVFQDEFREVAEGSYTVPIYGDIAPGALGTISVAVNFDWFADEYGDAMRTTNEVWTHTTTVRRHKSMPKYSWNEITGTFLQNNVPMKGYSFTVGNDGTGRISLPQFTYRINVTDVGNDDNIRLNNLHIVINGIDVTNTMATTRDSGATLSYIGEGLTILQTPFVTGARELGITPSDSSTVELWFTPTGLNHNGNGVSVQLLNRHPNNLQGPFYINNFGSGKSVMLTTAQIQTTGGIFANGIFSEDGLSHSGIPGNSSKTYDPDTESEQLPAQNHHQP